MLKKIISTVFSFSIMLTGILSISIIEPEDAEASSYNNLSGRPFMGWSSWSSIRKKPTEQNIKAAADIIAAKFKTHGYEYVNLDDYYQLNWTTHVDKYGRWVVDPKKFPHGMKALGNHIHKKGLKFGLYITLGIPKGAIDQNTPIEGTPYHARDIVDFSKGQKVSFNFDNMYSIDYSKPGAQEYIDSWARLFASYGVDYLKIDGVRNEDIPDIEAWAKALKKTGRAIHVELSNNLDINHISTWQKLANGWRTDHDVESYGKPTLTDWEHVARRFNHAAKWQPHAGAGGWNDFDSLNVANGRRDGLTGDEKRSYVSLWAIASSHFVIGSDLTKLDDYGISLLTNDEIIGVNQSGVAGKRLFKTANSEVFYQELPDGSYNVAFFNTGSSAQKVMVNWTDLGFDGPAMVHDRWSHEDLGESESGFKANLATHASHMIHVVPSSTLTVSPINGASEINPSSITLSWSAISKSDSYHVQVATDPDLTKVVVDRTVTSTSAKVKDLEKDTPYYWKVSSVTGGTETQIGMYSFHTKMTTAPTAPDWVVVNKKNNTVSLTWNPSVGASSYTVYRKAVNIFGFESYQPIATNIKAPRYVDKSTTAETNYAYVVTAKNRVGESEQSIEVQSASNQITIQLIALLTGFVIFVFIVTTLRIRRDHSNATSIEGKIVKTA
ncbi:fibronectin type III domain-containing protein [Neobacillus cucumis]|uniref:fibronectin type III domain-containing protein n=1 Tax=Neobacillus cucumis TaxID=1740721 RepID=UPI002E24C388|nr:alpha-galactosidase [Neobacillus cucumis]